MAATREDITRWFNDGKVRGYTHMIVVCDTFDYEDAPVYVLSDAEGARIAEKEEAAKPMQKVMEVYKLSAPLGEQINRFRCFNY